MKKRLNFALCAGAGICMGMVVPAVAQEVNMFQTSVHAPMKKARAESKEFTVMVRAISAEGAIPLSENMQSMPERPVELDERVEDLRSKLSRLPFTTFRLVSMDEEEITLMNRKTIHLSNGHSLCMRAVEQNGDSMTVWLKWKDDNGMSILDTRLNFALNESMVAGIEGQQDTGIILAVRVSPETVE